MSTIHLYNSSHQRGVISRSTEWTDLEKMINWEGSTYIFLGTRPEDPGECFRHYQFVMGVSVIARGKDRRGKSTAKLTSKGNLPISKNMARKFHLMSRFAELEVTESGRHLDPGSPRFTATRAAEDRIAMLEMIVAKHREQQQESGLGSFS